MTVRGRLQEADEFILESDIRFQNDTSATAGTGSGLTVYSGQTITAYVKTVGVPVTSTYPLLNCTVSSLITTTQVASGQHFSILKLNFGSSSSGSFQCYLNTSANRILQISGSYSTGTSTGAVQPLTLGMESGAKHYNNVGKTLDDFNGETIRLNDTDVRAIAEETTNLSTIDFDDLYGKEHNLGGIPVTYTGTNSYTDTAIPNHTTLGGTGSTSTTITNNPLQFVRRVKLTYSGTSASKYLHISAQRGSNGSYFHGDAQFYAYAINGTVYYIDTIGSTTSTNSGWRTKIAQLPSSTDPDEWHNSGGSETSVFHNTSGSNGQFVIKHTNAGTYYNRTSSSGTGRIPNPFITSLTGDNVGYGYFEASGSTTPARQANIYYHARSPLIYLNDGDEIEVWYGVDCASLDFIKFDIIGLS